MLIAGQNSGIEPALEEPAGLAASFFPERTDRLAEAKDSKSQTQQSTPLPIQWKGRQLRERQKSERVRERIGRKNRLERDRLEIICTKKENENGRQICDQCESVCVSVC